jgi:hypothetical protein
LSRSATGVPEGERPARYLLYRSAPPVHGRKYRSFTPYGVLAETQALGLELIEVRGALPDEPREPSS